MIFLILVLKMKKFKVLIIIITAAALLILYNLFEVHMNREYQSPLMLSSSSPKVTRLRYMSRCRDLTKWIVVISDTRTLTPAMITVLNTTTDWCLLVLGHHISKPRCATNLKMSNYIYMSSKEIASLPYKLVKIIDSYYHAFNRRNIGYLYAVDRGAKIVLDMEGNNIPHAIYQEGLYNIHRLHKIPELYRDVTAGNCHEFKCF